MSDDLLGFAEHLAFGDPEGGFRDGDGEVVDFDAVELVDGHENRGKRLAEEGGVLAMNRLDDLVFEAAKGKECLGKEIAGAAGGIKEGERGEFLLKYAEPADGFPPVLEHKNVVQFLPELVQEKRVDDLVDVLDAGVVHAAGAARFRVERAFEDRAENGRGDAAPVEVVAGLCEEQIFHLVVQERDFDVFIGEKAAVDIGKRGEVGREIGVAVLRLRVQNFEQVQHGPAEVFGGELGEIVVKLVFEREDARILGIQAENKADAEFVQAFECGFGGFVDVALQNLIIEVSDKLTCLYGKLHFALDVIVCDIDQEVEPGTVFGEFFEQNLIGGAGGILHVVDEERGEIASDDPTGMLGDRQLGDVAFRLFERGKERAIGLFDRGAQVFIDALLLDQDTGGWDDAIDEAGMIEFDLAFEPDPFLRFSYPEHIAQKREPEGLGFAFFISFALPVFGKLFCGFLLLSEGHAAPPGTELSGAKKAE